MKKLHRVILAVSLFFAIMFSGFVSGSAAQATTKFESLSTQTNVLAVYEYSDIGVFDTRYGTNIEIVLVSLHVPGERKAYGVYFDFVTAGQAKDTQTGILDADEVEPLLKALDQMLEMAQEMRGNVSREVYFTTRDGVRIGFSEGGGTQRAYAYLRGRASTSRTVFTVEKLRDLRDLLKKTLETLQALGAV